MFGINENVYKNLIDYFKENNQIKRVTLFGSRAKGNPNFNSDIDICIEYLGRNKGTIMEEINDLVGIYSCDIVFFDALNKELESQIFKYGVEIYKA